MITPHNRAEVSFEIIEEIGFEGKNSQVYKVHDHHLDAILVIKRIPKADFNGNQNEFFSEARVLYLSSHPYVVPVNYACEDSDYIYIALPFFQNGSLKKVIQCRALTIRETIRYGCQFLSGLHNIHSKGLIHFDVKPDNILISRNNEALVSDFGLARHTNHLGLAQPNQLYRKHVPPEALAASQFTPAFDIYQAGLCLYRMCNGEQIFEQQLSEYASPQGFDEDRFLSDVQSGLFPSRSLFLEHIPMKLKRIITKSLMVDPGERYASIMDLINDISSIDGNEIDWQFVDDGNERRWSKKSNGKTTYIKIDRQGSTEAKRGDESKGFRRITSHCKDNVTERELRRFFKEY
jgi:serine/threonine protein kinase